MLGYGASKPKHLTFCKQARIVDGDDGRTYLLELSMYTGTLSIMQGDMRHQAETICADDPRYLALLSMCRQEPAVVRTA